MMHGQKNIKFPVLLIYAVTYLQQIKTFTFCSHSHP